MQPLYFLAGVTPATLAPGSRLCRTLLASRGLADVFADVGDGDYCASELSGRGPGDRSGTILSYLTPAGQAARRVGYFPDEQRWTQVVDDVWIGIDPADPPSPDELRRRKLCDGYLVELGDGHRYVIPVIRRPDGSTDLPRDLATNPLTGRLEEPVKESYRRYWEASAEAAGWFFGEGFDSSSFTKERGLSLAIQAVSLNYRYGPIEQWALRLIDAQNYLTVLGTTVDVSAVLAAGEQKKSGDSCDVAGPSTSPGQPAA